MEKSINFFFAKKILCSTHPTFPISRKGHLLLDEKDVVTNNYQGIDEGLGTLLFRIFFISTDWKEWRNLLFFLQKIFFSSTHPTFPISRKDHLLLEENDAI